MGHFQLRSEQNMEYTLVSNYFLDHFLTEANDAQLKIYLYLLRQISGQKETDISLMADYFNYVETDIIRILTFWEKKNVLKLFWDDSHKLTGISLCDLTKSQPVKKEPAVFPGSSPKASTMLSHTVVPCATFQKPDYTLEQLSEFQQRESTSQLLFIAESYLGKSLSANDVRSMFFLSDTLHFSFDLIDYLLQYCIDRGKKDFRYIEKVAISWAQAHITTPEEASRQISLYDKQVYTVMNALGKSSTTPTTGETEFIKRWYQIYGFTTDIILEACERTVLATDKHRFEYADKILSNWKKAGVHHKPDIAKVDATYEKRKLGPTSVVSKNKFNQFKQNDYDFDTLEKELLSN